MVGTSRVVVMAVDEDADSRAQIRHELDKRYGADYRVECHGSPAAALEALQALADAGDAVALVLADLRLRGMSGPELLGRAAALHPTAKRALLVAPWSDRVATMSTLVESMARGAVDYFVVKPTQAPAEHFHRVVTEFLDEWTRAHTVRTEAVRMVADASSPRTRELMDLLQRNNVPTRLLAAGTPQARELLEAAGATGERLPVLLLFDGTVLVDPTREQIAEGLGARASLRRDGYDLLIVGAGPSGLGAAVYAASEGLRTLVCEREAMGGQAGTTSLIRNYLGFPRGLSGSELALRAYEQAVMFGTEFDFGREVTGLRSIDDDKVVVLGDGTEVRARAVIVACGVTYRRLGIPTVEALLGRGVFYGAAVAEAKAMRGGRVFVVGGGNSAGQAALHLARYAAQVSVLVRGEGLARSMSSYLVSQIDAASNIDVRPRTRVAGAVGEGRLEALVLEGVDGGRQAVAADGMFVFIGARPRTGWLPGEVLRDDSGFVLTGNDLVEGGRLPPGWPLERPPLMLEASMPGLFVAGDVRHGSVKRVASAVGEGAMALHACHAYFDGLEAPAPGAPA